MPKIIIEPLVDRPSIMYRRWGACTDKTTYMYLAAYFWGLEGVHAGPLAITHCDYIQQEHFSKPWPIIHDRTCYSALYNHSPEPCLDKQHRVCLLPFCSAICYKGLTSL